MYILYHTARILRAQVPFEYTSLDIYVQVVFPIPYPVGDLGKTMQYTSKTKDIQNKGEGKGLTDHAAREPMAISEWTSTVFASLEAT